MRTFLKLTAFNEEFPMRWATQTFGKHAGKTLPEIILSDADWFFWALNTGALKGRFASEAAKVEQRAPNAGKSNILMTTREGSAGFGSLKPILLGIAGHVRFADCRILICYAFGGARHMISGVAGICCGIFDTTISATHAPDQAAMRTIL
jgi:hypothetical protein